MNIISNQGNKPNQFCQITAEQLKADYANKLITADGYIYYLAKIYCSPHGELLINSDRFCIVWNISKTSFCRALKRLSKNELLITRRDERGNTVIYLPKERERLGLGEILKMDRMLDQPEHSMAVDYRKDYKKFLKSDYWQECRKLVLFRDKNTCQRCGSKQNLHVHHLTYKNHRNELNHLNDLQTVCKTCHEIVHL